MDDQSLLGDLFLAGEVEDSLTLELISDLSGFLEAKKTL